MQQTVTALFQTRAHADAAVEKLVQAGVPRSSIDVVAGRRDTYTSQPDASYDRGRDEGFWAALKDMFMPEEDRYVYSEGLSRGGVMVAVRTDSTQVHAAEDVLENAGGTIDLDQEEAGWRSSGWSGYAGSAATGAMAAGTGVGAGMAATGRATTGRTEFRDVGATTGMGAEGLATTPGAVAGGTASVAGRTAEAGAAATFNAAREAGAAASRTGKAAAEARGGRDETISVYEERLKVGKRVVDRGRVRLRSYVVETPVNEQVTLRNETVEIERHPVDRAVTAADAKAFTGGERVIEAEARSEEAVVSKDVRVKEEVGLRKTAEERTETISDKVRHTEVEVEDGRGAASTWKTDDRTGTGTRTGTDTGPGTRKPV